MATILDSVLTNPDVANIRQTTGSTDWLWAAFAILLFTDLCLVLNTYRVR
jgi:bacteriorhodopsin